MKCFDEDGTEMVPCNCGYFGDRIGRLITECCNGSRCSCGGEPVDLGPCRICKGTGYRRVDADTRKNIEEVRRIAEATGGYIGRRI